MSVFIDRDLLKRLMVEKRMSYSKLEGLSYGLLTKSKLLNRASRREDHSIRLNDKEAKELGRILDEELNIPLKVVCTSACRADYELSFDAIDLRESLFSERTESYDVDYQKRLTIQLQSHEFTRLLNQARSLYTILTDEEDQPGYDNKVSRALTFIGERCAPGGMAYSAGMRLPPSYLQVLIEKIISLPGHLHADRAIYFHAYALALTYSLFFRILLISVDMRNPYRKAKITDEYGNSAMSLEKITKSFLEYLVNQQPQVENQDDFWETGKEYELNEHTNLLIVACDAIVNHSESSSFASQYVNSKRLQSMIERERRLLEKLGLPPITLPAVSDLVDTDFGKEALIFQKIMREQKLCEKYLKEQIENQTLFHQLLFLGLI